LTEMNFKLYCSEHYGLSRFMSSPGIATQIGLFIFKLELWMNARRFFIGELPEVIKYLPAT
jgi:hypothetical protein